MRQNPANLFPNRNTKLLTCISRGGRNNSNVFFFLVNLTFPSFPGRSRVKDVDLHALGACQPRPPQFPFFNLKGLTSLREGSSSQKNQKTREEVGNPNHIHNKIAEDARKSEKNETLRCKRCGAMALMRLESKENKRKRRGKDSTL